MGGVEIAGYEPLVNDVKELIHKKQYHVLKIMNTETINLYWEIGEEIYRQQEINGWGKSIVVKRVAERVSGREGIFCGKPLENAQLLPELPQF